MNTLQNEKIWHVDSLQRKANQFGFLKQEMKQMQTEMQEMRTYFLQQMAGLELQVQRLRRENARLRKRKSPLPTDWADQFLVV
ncbi:MAG TPA: hypothetical protein DCM08_09460 [Microscillaceae bacterium]|jgi:TolA-binding protein|nr:hypothetical protein [Microscillaceae bacterium]